MSIIPSEYLFLTNKDINHKDSNKENLNHIKEIVINPLKRFKIFKSF